MVTKIGLYARTLVDKDKAGQKLAAIRSDLENLKCMGQATQKRQDALARLSQARDALRSYLRFMMFFLDPDKQRQLTELLSRIEALIESGSRDSGLSLAQASADKATVIQVNLEYGGEGFLEKAARLLAKVNSVLNEPEQTKRVERF
ncbi:MAG: hypothetical protein EBV01_14885 [Betaproteobacteria bacterium]|nr:hypothetical protein [Betaproteobacteria bacterium]NBP40617.1 hypothetical protein [Betaproteobacteria bacterium]NBQ10191.1 hypothetical protein [Betaproteobacteria bacterium]NBQ80219.1 hypothetical protein [Betaproteobacteria bacterium]NBS40814.1 hypothetical protein [Betaproteobacteria bacterium]